MQWSDINDSKKKLFLILAAVVVFNLGVLVVCKFVVDKAADRVIQKLQRDYSPSPYGPGFDPDKINPNGFKTSKVYLENRKSEQQEPTIVTESIQRSDDWRSDWEKTRGFVSYGQ